MLLRASRAAGGLTKEALIGKMVGKTLGYAVKNPMKTLGAGMVAASTVPAVRAGTQRSSMGLQGDYLQAANAGMVPSVPPAAG